MKLHTTTFRPFHIRRHRVKLLSDWLHQCHPPTFSGSDTPNIHLEHPRHEIHNLNLLEHRFRTLDEFFMRRIRSHVILAIHRVFEFGNKGVRYTILITPQHRYT